MTPYVVTIDGTEYTVTHTPVEGFALLASVSFASPDSPTGQDAVSFGNWAGAWMFADEVSDRGRAALAYLEWLEAREAAS